MAMDEECNCYLHMSTIATCTLYANMQPMVAIQDSFSARLNDACDSAGIVSGHGRVADLHRRCKAAGMNVSSEAVRKWLFEDSLPRMKNAASLAKLLDSDIQGLLVGAPAVGGELQWNALATSGELESGTVVVPRFFLAASAGDGLYPPDEPVIDRMVLKQSWVRRMFPAVSLAALAIMSVQGDSMAPTLRDGDLMLIDRSVEEIGPEGVYVLTIEDELYVKRVQREPGTLLIKSDNAMYRTWEVPRGSLDQVRVHGRMVYYWRGDRG
ncbi:MAG: S24 family peptidase [Gammaproteobacteria bacterium]